MPGLVPGIHDLTTTSMRIRGCPGQARAWPVGLWRPASPTSPGGGGSAERL